ncbi:MAG TPA: DMT family transporter [Actinomycetota bacterium]
MVTARPSLRDEIVGGAIVAASAMAFGTVVVLAKVASNRGMPVGSLLGFRFGIAALVLAVVVRATGRSLRPPRGEALRLFLMGAVGYAVESGLFFLSLERGTPGAVSLLFFTYPVWVAGVAALAGQGLPGPLVAGSLLFAVGGAALVVASSGGVDITALGIVFALSSSGSFAVYLVAFDVLVRRSTPLVSSLWVSGGTSLALSAFAVASGTGELPASPAVWWTVIGMGVLTAGAFLGLFAGLRRIGPVRTSIVGALEPVAAAGLAFAFLGDAMRPGTLAGGALIVGAAVAATLARRPVRADPVP